MTDRETLNAALAHVAAGRATARIKDGRASVVLDVTGFEQAAREALEADVLTAALALPGVEGVSIAFTSDKVTRRLIAVASGKGGVGKSTVAANLAVALRKAGLRVGMVDADVYGPSQMTLLGVEGRKAVAREKQLIPVVTPSGVPVLSMAAIADAGRALAWRGPMAGGALLQLIEGDWGATDTLVLDLPPGTGDVQLTMVQKHKPAGAVVVSTPQDLALIDARRAIDLFAQTGVPVIGLIENMAGYACPACGTVSDPFGSGGAEAAAAELGIPFLGRVPLAMAIRLASDAGTPPAGGDGPEAALFAGIAGKVSDWLDAR